LDNLRPVAGVLGHPGGGAHAGVLAAIVSGWPCFGFCSGQSGKISLFAGLKPTWRNSSRTTSRSSRSSSRAARCWCGRRSRAGGGAAHEIGTLEATRLMNRADPDPRRGRARRISPPGHLPKARHIPVGARKRSRRSASSRRSR
jgi:hypothetical protein